MVKLRRKLRILPSTGVGISVLHPSSGAEMSKNLEHPLAKLARRSLRDEKEEGRRISGRGFLGLSQNGVSAHVAVGAQCRFIMQAGTSGLRRLTRQNGRHDRPTGS